MARIHILGAGMVGSTMALDLAGSHDVSLADRSRDSLETVQNREPSIRIKVLDVIDHAALLRWLEPADLVLCAVPGFLGFETLRTIIEAGKNGVDISFMPGNALELDSFAKAKCVTIVVDSGVAPGMSNLVLGYYNRMLEVQAFRCLVGGLPKNPQPPFNYKAPFSPLDVLEEYTRPARIMVDGVVETRPALSDVEEVHIPPVGELEAFNTDGLRSLLTTMAHIPNMVEKTLRYPGHAALMDMLKSAGFFQREEIRLKTGRSVQPLELTAALLTDAWKLVPGEGEFTVMDIEIHGEKKGRKVEIHYQLFDETDPETGFTSMARTTGFTATAMVNLLLEGGFTKKGVFPPEIVGGQKGCLSYILDYLKKRGVVYQRTEKEVK